MNQILQGWNKVLKDYRHWKMILKYPYCAFDTCVFFGNLGHPPNSLVDYYVAGMKQLDAECAEILYDNLWELYDGIEEQMKENDEDLKNKVPKNRLGIYSTYCDKSQWSRGNGVQNFWRVINEGHIDMTYEFFS